MKERRFDSPREREREKFERWYARDAVNYNLITHGPKEAGIRRLSYRSVTADNAKFAENKKRRKPVPKKIYSEKKEKGSPKSFILTYSPRARARPEKNGSPFRREQ